ELRNLMFTAQQGLSHPIAIRYPRGKGFLMDWEKPFERIEIGTGVCLKEGSCAAVLSVGTTAYQVSKALELTENLDIAHYDMRFVKPLDEQLLHEVFKKHTSILTVEDGTINGGFGSAILEFAAKNNYATPIELLGIPDFFVEHGTTEQLKEIVQLDSKSIASRLLSLSR
ncbi:MAG: 1-deoxy-D-xylulose-5-phosphate synthase, partial [Mangrovimonas sp.]|nr:1-deoxy-D-xylulose-5-phosphate synthase [Mangrovimonas sp.]